jgi:SNF2-related domain/Helicase conserved C-terminal domain
MPVVISKTHKQLVVPALPEVANIFPGAPTIQNGVPSVLIPHRMRETLLLRHLNFKIPNPMLTHYDWRGGEPFEVQRKTCALLSEHDHAYVLNDMGCVDADTEYLTPTGWKRIADYGGGDVAQYWPDREEIEFVTPTAYMKKPCSEMIRFKTNYNVDQLLSPEHRVLLDCGLVVSAENIEQVYGPKIRRLLKFRTTFSVAGTSGLPYSDAQLRLQVAVNADGYVPPAKNRLNKTHVRLKKERKIRRLRTLLKSAGIVYIERPCLPKGFRIFSFSAPAPKGFSADWWQASQHQLNVIAAEAVHWDGTQRKAKGRGFFSNKKADADFIQYAYSASGCSSSLRRNSRNEYTVHAAHGKTVVGLFGCNGISWRKNIWREPSPDGFKYCFSVPSAFLLLRRNGCIFATGNTGKTRAALWSFDYLREEGLAHKALVVAPLSTLSFVWAREIFATLPHIRSAVLHGTKVRRLERLNEDADIYIINHHGLKVIGDEIAKRGDIDTLIIDELAVYRNNSQRAKYMRDFARRFKIVWGMTGRPMPNEPPDVWSQCKIITPSTVPKFKKQAVEILMNRVNIYKTVPKPNAVETAYSWMQPSVRYKLEDVVELPPVIERRIDVALSKQQQKVYDQLVKDLRVMIDQHQITALNAGAAMSKLLQIAGGWVYTKNPEFVELDAEPRITGLLDILEAAERKVLLFVPFRHMLEGLSKRLTKEGINHCTVHGQTTGRDQIFNIFQNTTEYHVMNAHPECLAHGLNLTAADTVVWWSPTASLDIYDQANARIRRYGQTHKQQIFHFQATPIERRLYSLLRSKQKIQDKFLSLVEDATAGRLP